jgi:hypothetical protein
LRFEGHTAVKMTMLVLWVVTLCGLTGGKQEDTLSIFRAEDADDMFLRNVGIYL